MACPRPHASSSSRRCSRSGAVQRWKGKRADSRAAWRRRGSRRRTRHQHGSSLARGPPKERVTLRGGATRAPSRGLARPTASTRQASRAASARAVWTCRPAMTTRRESTRGAIATGALCALRGSARPTENTPQVKPRQHRAAGSGQARHRRRTTRRASATRAPCALRGLARPTESTRPARPRPPRLAGSGQARYRRLTKTQCASATRAPCALRGLVRPTESTHPHPAGVRLQAFNMGPSGPCPACS